ncbi:gamma-tubulin complex component 5 [Anastrepha ludens]|uniref:gamma-tubulin complex component 5 n=1 Tax=Anastrepha ludens TaxID=28586 RepID=UPI0023B0D84A|nr:gamma-tubulin complex component 5 [Anastrepha ludens]
MSAQEARNEIIRENIPKLIKELTGVADDETLKSYELLAWSVIRNHRNLSTNSHEVRRKIEGIKEKFAVDNNLEYAEHLGRLCDEIIQHPLCMEHYEVDVHWSLLDFLLSLAHNPTGALRRNKEKIGKMLQEHDDIAQAECIENETDYWKKVLQDDFILVEPLSNSSSDLSSWSDDLSDELKTISTEEEVESRNSHALKINPTPPRGMENIEPPKKSLPYYKYDSSTAEERLLSMVQHSWWEKGIKTVHPHIESTNKEANFALEYRRHIKATTSHRIPEEPETATEYSLLREIFWMFQVPLTCKFFHVNGESITIRKNVTLTSTRPIAISSMLEDHFLPYICMMQDLRNFNKLIYTTDDYTPPNTLEHYAASLELLLAPIWNELLACEKDLLVQPDFEINTVISLHHKLRPAFAKLAYLHNIHQQAVQSIRLLPAHISSVHLLAALIHCNQIATTATETNLAMSLFLASVKIFLIITDTWWTEGRLDDWHNEFIIERVDEPGQSIRVREFNKNKEKAFFVPTHISKMIIENSFFQLLLEHSLEAGCTLNLLYEINRIGELRSAYDAIEGKLYNVFIEDVLKYVRILQKQIVEAVNEAKENDRLEIGDDQIVSNGKDVEVGVVDGSNEDVVDEVLAAMHAPEGCYEDDQILKKLTTNDDFLLLAFTMNMNLSETENRVGDQCDARVKDAAKNEPNALEIFEQFEQSKHILPLEEVVLNALSRILKTRIAFANSFVMRLYLEEFDILKHLRNIRKIYLLEASDVMHQFYNKLFKQIESGEEWANAFLITTQLDDIICTKFLDMSSLFRIEINSAFRCQTVKVYEAVDELSLTYNLSTELTHMIKQEDLDAYNKVFRFLLKVKWGLTTLENLQFPPSHKRKMPYAPFEMADLLMRRLEQLRFWMLFAIQSIHFHLMTHVIQSMGEQLDEKIVKCTNLKEMVTVHRSYINTVLEHCFLVDNFSSLKLGVEQLLNLAYILRLEWRSCVTYIEANSNPWAVVDVNESADDIDYVTNSQIDAIELTYIRCHQYLANKLNNEVYIKHNSFLLGLSTAFNTSLPY